MTTDAGIVAIIDALGLPPDARVDARVPKKLLVELGAPTSADKRAIQVGIDELQWLAACKPTTIGVPSFADDTREYLEIAVVACAFRPGAKAARLIELIHRAIPYPVLLVTTDEQGVVLSAAHILGQPWLEGANSVRQDSTPDPVARRLTISKYGGTSDIKYRYFIGLSSPY
jgi:hypothetical protein